jgi:capsular exopolysaccharide synthesis family protein
MKKNSNHPRYPKTILELYDKESPAATEFRRLYSNLRHMDGFADLKSILVTSATSEEGKTLVASFLAITIAHYHDCKTLLIDSDLRRPVVHQLFDLELKKGLAEVLEGKLPLKECWRRTGIGNLQVLTAGEGEKTPTELLDSPRLTEVLEEAKFYFDLIVVDSAPIIPVSDVMILMPEAEGALIVVKAGATPREVVKRAAELVQNAGGKILGIVMNNLEGVLPYYYNYNYYGYEYGYGGKRDSRIGKHTPSRQKPRADS